MWDSIADQTICIDYTLTKRFEDVIKIHLTKNIEDKTYNFSRKRKGYK